MIGTDLNSLKTALDQIRAELKIVDEKDGLFEVMTVSQLVFFVVSYLWEKTAETDH